MFLIFVLIGFFGFFITLLGIVIAMFRKKSKRKWTISMVVCIFLFFISLILTPESEVSLEEAQNQIVDEIDKVNAEVKVEVDDTQVNEEKIKFEDKLVLEKFEDDGYYNQYYYTYDINKYEYPSEADIREYTESVFDDNKKVISNGCLEIYIGFGVDKSLFSFAFKDGVKQLENFTYNDEEMYNAILSIGKSKELELSNSDELTTDDLERILNNSLGDDENFTSIVHEDESIVLSVNLGNVEYEEKSLAIVRASDFTEKILKYENLDEYWENIIINFENIGSIKFDKSMIVDSAYGRHMNIDDEMLIQ